MTAHTGYRTGYRKFPVEDWHCGVVLSCTKTARRRGPIAPDCPVHRVRMKRGKKPAGKR